MSLFRPQFWKIPEISDDERRRLPELTAALERRLKDIAARYPQAVFASSLAVEDMVITDAVCRLKLPIRIITLNTGKLNPETTALIAETNARYQTELEVFYPNRQTAAEFEAEFGTAAMYDSQWLHSFSFCAIPSVSGRARVSLIISTSSWMHFSYSSTSSSDSPIFFRPASRRRSHTVP